MLYYKHTVHKSTEQQFDFLTHRYYIYILSAAALT